MRRIVLFTAALWMVSAPMVRAADAAKPNTAPTGFTALFNGKDLANWKADAKTAEHWEVEDGVLHYDGKGGDLRTRRISATSSSWPTGRSTKAATAASSSASTASAVWDDPEGSGGLWNNKEAGKKRSSPTTPSASGTPSRFNSWARRSPCT